VELARRALAPKAGIAAAHAEGLLFFHTAKVVRRPPHDQLNPFRKHALLALIVGAARRATRRLFDADPSANGTPHASGLAERIESLTIPGGRPSVASRRLLCKGGPSHDRSEPDDQHH
jgi:hypothetical protein